MIKRLLMLSMCITELREKINSEDEDTLRILNDMEILLGDSTEPIENDWHKMYSNKENVVIELLNSGVGVDGETMQYIIEKVGMNDQMLRQLIMTNPESEVKDLLEEKIMLSNNRK